MMTKNIVTFSPSIPDCSDTIFYLTLLISGNYQCLNSRHFWLSITMHYCPGYFVHSTSTSTFYTEKWSLLVKNCRQKVFNRGILYFCRKARHSKIDKNPSELVFHISIWGAKPTKTPRGDGIDFFFHHTLYIVNNCRGI